VVKYEPDNLALGIGEDSEDEGQVRLSAVSNVTLQPSIGKSQIVLTRDNNFDNKCLKV